MVWQEGVGVVLLAAITAGVFAWLRHRRCLFCAIVSKTVPATILHEDDECLCIKDVSPAGEHHFLVVPKRHISNVNELTEEDLPLVDKLAKVGRQVLEKHLPKSQRFTMAFTRPPFNTVPHLHLHCVSLPLTCGWLRGLALTSSWFAAPIIDVRRSLRARPEKKKD